MEPFLAIPGPEHANRTEPMENYARLFLTVPFFPFTISFFVTGEPWVALLVLYTGRPSLHSEIIQTPTAWSHGGGED
jgi:hypothetical protein